MPRVIVLAGILLGLAGCTPGEAEFTLKTSEVRKALRGEVAQICVRETMTTMLSNANRRVSFGGGKFTNQLDVVKALAAKAGKSYLRDCARGCSTNISVDIWVDEPMNALPCVKLEAHMAVALGTKPALGERAAAGVLVEPCALQIDPKTGKIGEMDGGCDNGNLLNVRNAACWGAAMARGALLETLFDDEIEGDLMAVDKMLTSVLTPTWFKQLSCVIVGDDDVPLYVIAEDVRVDGNPVVKFEGWVKKGETIRLELDKKKHGDGGIRFFLAKPEALNGMK